MLDIIFKVVEAIVGGLAVGAAVAGTIYLITNWPEISDKIASWLRQNNLSKSALMSALVICDRTVSGVSRRIVVETTRHTGKQTIEEKTLSMEEIRRELPSDVYRKLQETDHVELDVMKTIQ